MDKQLRRYHCPECNKIVDPIVIGRAKFDCDQCGKDITLAVLFQYEAIMEYHSLYQPFILFDTTMTNYEKIKFLLEMGVYKGVEVMYEDTDPTINNKSIIDTMRDLDLWSVGNKDRSDITSITPILNPPKLLSVGTKVRVFEERDEYMSKEYFEVQSIYIGNYTLKGQLSTIVSPARAVYPVFEE